MGATATPPDSRQTLDRTQGGAIAERTTDALLGVDVVQGTGEAEPTAVVYVRDPPPSGVRERLKRDLEQGGVKTGSFEASLSVLSSSRLPVVLSPTPGREPPCCGAPLPQDRYSQIMFWRW